MMCNCEKCLHTRVCGHKEKYQQYIEEFNKLNKKWDLFQTNPNCPEYTDKSILRTKESDYINSTLENENIKNTFTDLNKEEENDKKENIEELSKTIEFIGNYLKNGDISDYEIELPFEIKSQLIKDIIEKHKYTIVKEKNIPKGVTKIYFPFPHLLSPEQNRALKDIINNLERK